MNSLEQFMFDLNDHVVITKSGHEPLLDATFLGTLQLKTHRALIESAIDQPNKTIPVIRALSEFGHVHTHPSKKPKVTDAIRLVSKLRDALLDQPRPTQNVRDAIHAWVREETEDAPPKRRKADAD